MTVSSGTLYGDNYIDGQEEDQDQGWKRMTGGHPDDIFRYLKHSVKINPLKRLNSNLKLKTMKPVPYHEVW